MAGHTRVPGAAAGDPARGFARTLAPPGRLLSVRPSPRGALALELEHAAGELAIALDGSVRIRLAPGGALPPEPGPALGREAWPLAALELHARGDDGFVATNPRTGGGPGAGTGGSPGAGPTGGPKPQAPALRVELDADPFAVRVLDAATPEAPPLAVLDDFVLRSEPGASQLGGGRVSLASPPREHLFGLGQRRGALDRRGRVLLLRCQDAGIGLEREAQYSSIPFLLMHDVSAARSRGVLLDTAGVASVDAAVGDDECVVLACAFGALDVTIHPGPEPRDVLRRFTAQVGRTALPPRWALGHHQSRWSYDSERAVRRIARGIGEHAMPTDAIHLDLGHMEDHRSFRWHPRRFPDPKGLLDELAREGLHAVASTHPGIDRSDPLHAEAAERDLLCGDRRGGALRVRLWPGDCSLPDFGREEVREWWADQHAALLAAGCAGIQVDMNEPSGWQRDVRLGRARTPLATFGEPDFTNATQRALGDGKESVPHESVRGVYGLQQCRASRAALERARPGERHFVLSRAGCQGIQRVAALWTGDSRSTWNDLRESLRMLLGLSVSGVALCGADIGGFAGRPSPELFARWMQIGALQPFARTHSWWRSRGHEPWRFGRRCERIARRALALRMRLLPYLGSLLHESARTGAPLWRPLFHEFPHDGESVFCDDQVMLGPWLLLAPVLEHGARSREVYLPPGVWLDWHDDARHVGPKHVRVAAPLERMPMFLRGGAALPTQSAELRATAVAREPFVVEVAPGGDGETTLVEDDGRSEGGPVAETRLRVSDRRAGRLRFEIARREGGFAVAPRTARVVLRGCGVPSVVRLDGVPLTEGHAVPGYRLAGGRVDVRLDDDGEQHSIELEPSP